LDESRNTVRPSPASNLSDLRVTGPEQAMAAFRYLAQADAGRASLAALVLDQSQRVCSASIATTHSIADALNWLSDFVLAGTSDASPRAVVLVVNRPGGSTVPGLCELTVWRDATYLCRSRGVILLDVLIVSGHRWRSLAETEPIPANVRHQATPMSMP
jgi:DNA repair protein RadC